MPKLMVALCPAALLVAALGCATSGADLPTAPTSTSATTGSSSGSSTTPPAPVTGLTYVKDVQPILNSDCIVCHRGGAASAGVDLSSYTGVMRVVTPGSANSILVLVTQPGGLMSSLFRGNPGQKSSTIYQWVVNNNAAEQ